MGSDLVGLVARIKGTTRFVQGSVWLDSQVFQETDLEARYHDGSMVIERQHRSDLDRGARKGRLTFVC